MDLFYKKSGFLKFGHTLGKWTSLVWDFRVVAVQYIDLGCSQARIRAETHHQRCISILLYDGLIVAREEGCY